MSLTNAFKAFFKAWKYPAKADEFLKDDQVLLENEKGDFSHLRLLNLLQQNSRLIDFLKEDISSYTDAQVGAAVRKIHHDCSKSLEELVTIRPLMEQNEGDSIVVNKEYDTNAIKVIGNIKGEPPYTGVLIHKGWKAHKRSLPKRVGELNPDVIFPAEIEVIANEKIQ